MTYAVKEVFPTLQGEGFHAGRSAVFVRFAGCNLWTGLAEHRNRDAERHGAACPRWCDTDFFRGQSMGLPDLMAHVRIAADTMGGAALVVFTGGEPLLQLDRALVDAVHDHLADSIVAIETNGTTLPKDGVQPDWVCVSPKVPVERLAVTSGNELKVVYPTYDPLDYESIAGGFDHLFVSPEASVSGVGVSDVSSATTQAAADFVMRHPAWRLSLQTHKLIGLP